MSYNSLSQLYAQEAHKPRKKMSEYCEHIRNLNLGQLQIVMFNHAWCKAAIHALHCGRSIECNKIFLSGPRGTGKGHAMKLICRDVIHFLEPILT